MSDLNTTGTDWIARLGLEAHPEGGWFRRIYTSAIQFQQAQRSRPLATSIYYLLDTQQPRGCLHRNRSDILHFLIDGGPIDYLTLTPDGELRRTRMGGDGGEHFLLVPGGNWKASQLLRGAAFGLIAEVVTPGFDYADHEFADEAGLRAAHPQHVETLKPFLRSGPRE